MRDEAQDESRHRSRVSRGMTSTARQKSPSRGLPRSPSREVRHHSPTRPDQHLHRDRNHDRRASPDSSRRRAPEQDDLIPRFREQQTRSSHSVHDHLRQRSRSRGPDRARVHTHSPPSVKRQRSRSHSPDPRHRRKKSRRHASPSRRSRGDDQEATSRHRRRNSSHNRRKSPPRSHASPGRGEEDSSRTRRHRRSESPLDISYRHSRRDPLTDDREDLYHPSSRSPKSGSRQSSTNRASTHQPISSSRREPGLEASGALVLDRSQDYPIKLPRHPVTRPDHYSQRDTPDPQNAPRSDQEGDMSSRGGHRGVSNQMHSNHHDDFHAHPRSPLHSNSYSQSPTQSPYIGSRGDLVQSHHHEHHHSTSHRQGPGQYGPPSGPSGNYHKKPPLSPSYGPSPSQNSHRGRGINARGSAFNGSGGGRGSRFTSSQWDAAGAGRDRPAEVNSNRQALPNETEAFSRHTFADESSARDRNDDQPDSESLRTKAEPPRGPSGRAPPTGPSNPGNASKFSFAFKPSSKPMAAAPKPEISQKFNAASQRRVSLDRSQHERSQNDRSQNDRPPPTAPREPASARARADPRSPPDGPRIAPRMRKIKKTMRRPKIRPSLPQDLVGSDSVFFRKPGNESVVGSGTYGKVFKGLNVYTKGLVALKRIRMEGERDGFPVTAVREIKLLQSLRHTNIVKLQEVMVERNDCFMVFEYLSHDLTGLLNHPSFKLEPAQKKHMAKQMFEGLEYLHNRGVLHRDIKAANILVSSEGILKLADFGLARFYAKHHRLDYTNRVITIWYRSPELLLGETKYTAAVDIWSAACVMVEIFTRHAIFAGDGTELSQLTKIYNVMGTPNLRDWPGLIDMPWFELLKPTVRQKNVFAEKYQERVTPAAFQLLSDMFLFDPAKRPNATEVLQHAYFTSEDPLPRQAIELASIDGDWHEFESKALRKENERKDREARRRDAASRNEKDKKRPIEEAGSAETQDPRDSKRQHLEDAKSAPENGGAAVDAAPVDVSASTTDAA